MDEKQLDLSIIQVNIEMDLSKDERRFYRVATIDQRMASTTRKPQPRVSIEIPLCRDHRDFAQYISKRHAQENDKLEELVYDRPVELEDQVRECTPQFILRNIPKIEHYYDLDRRLYFDEESLPVEEAFEAFQEAHTARFDPPEMPDFKSIAIINDFRVFLEEIFYLCPWDQISHPRRKPPEDSPWHPKYSNAQLAQYLLDAQNTLFIFSERGITTMATKPREYVDKPNNKPLQSFGLPPGC